MYYASVYPSDLCDLPKIYPIRGIAEGRVIDIRGKVHSNANRFVINIQSDHRLEGHSDIALHFNPRFSDGEVVRNSFEDGGWQNEERHGGFPFGRDQHFQLTIHFEWDRYRILVNGSHFTDFAYRIPKEAGGMLKIDGDLCVDAVYFSTDENAAAPPSRSPSVPVTKWIGRMYPGRTISVRGRPNPDCQRFNFNLQSGSHEDADIAFHLDVRHEYDGEYGTLVRNHREGGSWGDEERDAYEFPFARNQDFAVDIHCDPYGFKVAVGYKHMLEFRHRLRPENVNTLLIDGDVYISDIQ